MNTIINFFNHPFFIIFGGLPTILAVFSLLYKIISWLLWITPMVFRIGNALCKREIAIFWSLEQFGSLKASLIDSNIFKEKNIIHIEVNNIEKAKDKTVFLVDRETFKEKIEEVFNIRNSHQTAIIIYAKPQSIPNETMSDIANRPNTVVVNFRGRLLNDILTSLITTSYDK